MNSQHQITEKAVDQTGDFSGWIDAREDQVGFQTVSCQIKHFYSKINPLYYWFY